METPLNQAWVDALTAAGYEPGALVGSGMEGTVVAVGDGVVAKVWHHRPAAELGVLRDFYDALVHGGFTLLVPRILQVVECGDRAASVEVRLPGRPLRLDMGSESYPFDAARVDCLLDTLAALAEVTPSRALTRLPVLGSEPPMDGARDFRQNLAELLRGRTQRFISPLSAAVHKVDTLVDATVRQLDQMASTSTAVIHGDLIPANIHVDDEMRPLAALDFGFLTTVGDPAFDAAVAAGVFDMYGVNARAAEAVIDEATTARFGYDAQHLMVYRAAYALITSNCFSPSGSDGHFDWCVRMLQRRSVLEALEL